MVNLMVNPLKLRRRAHKLFFIDKTDKEELEKDKTDKEITSEIGAFAKKRFERKYALFVNSATRGIEIILEALNLDRSSEIITPAFQCSDALEIIEKYCKIKTCDVDINDLSINRESLKKNISKKTKIIMPVNLYGFPEDMPFIRELCKKNKIFLLEDCAHSIDSSIGGRKIGSWGDASVFSFSKALSATRGGIILTDSSSLYKELLKINEKRSEKTKGTSFLEKFYLYSLTKMRALQKIFPFSLILEKLISKNRDEKYYEELSLFEKSLCLSQLKKTDDVSENYRENYVKLYNLLRNVKGIKLIELDNNTSPLRFPILFNENKDVGEILLLLYRKGGFEPSLNYYGEYKINKKYGNKLKNSDFLENRLLVCAVDNLSEEDINELGGEIKKIR